MLSVLALGHTAHKQQTWNLNPGVSVLESMLFPLHAGLYYSHNTFSSSSEVGLMAQKNDSVP